MDLISSTMSSEHGPGAAAPVVVQALAVAAAAHRYDRKLLVCRRMGVGRELLRTLALRGVPWIGFEVTTPLRLAHDVVATDLAAQGLAVVDEFEELAFLDAAMDAVLDGAGGRLAELAEGPGLRQAVTRSVRALRMAGIGAAQVERARFRDEDKRAHIARILDVYEQLLRDAGRVDAAGLYARATASVAVGDARLPAGPIYLLPGQSTRGLSGQLLELLLERGAHVLPADPVHGLAPPTGWLVPELPEGAHAAAPLSWLHDVRGWARASPAQRADESGDVALDVFTATSVAAELREVLRRVLAAQLPWDEVEIVATDALVYGVALDALAQRLDIPVSYAAGLPLARTRPGRAVAKYLEWVEQGFPADRLRQLFERGDIASPDPAVSGMALARQLRALRIGAGRARYEGALARRERSLELPQPADDEQSPEEFEEERARQRAEVAALAAVVRRVLAATPPIPERASAHEVAVAPADLARGLLAVLELVPAATAVDRTARARLSERLERSARSLTRRTNLAAATALLLSRLDDRVPAPEAEGGSPWTSAGGHLHLSDLEHGGYANRRATFIVGLDAARFPGAGGGDALLVDDDRRRLTAGQRTPALPTAAERIDERRHAFAALVARLRGRVTFSYAMWDAVEGRGVAPAAELLQAYRLLSGDATADYERLHDAAAPAASAVPRGSALLDADDVWLHALARGGALRQGGATVCGVYPHLAAGLQALHVRRRTAAATAHHGVIAPRPSLDPRDHPRRVVSATQLQTLGTCPHRYLLRHVLHVRPPDDPQLSPEQWLSPLDRGALMHSVFERALAAVLAGRADLHDPAFERLVLEVLEDEIAAWRERVPPPGGAVFAAECDAMRDDARAFMAMVRDDGARFVALEQKFGRNGEPPIALPLPDGRTIRLAGAIDRIDRLEDDRLVVIDYKTGSSFSFQTSRGTYDGGRRLQHALYARVAEQLFGAEVARAEYQFPTRRSENTRVAYEGDRLRDGLGLVNELLELIAHGWFVPTSAPEDCRFCDFREACRVRVNGFDKVTSPLAEWASSARDASVQALIALRRR